MKKILCFIISLLSIISILGFGAINGAAYFGIGVQVMAKEVTMIKTGLIGQKLCFTDADFKSALVLSDFESITVTEIPSSTEGTLLLSGRRVGQGRVIKRKNLGSLVFIPASDSVSQCSFKFTVAKYAGGAEIECIMKFIDKVNYAPTSGVDRSGSLSVSTQESILVYGDLYGSDPEGDAIEYIIISYPSHGSIDLTDNGRYCYTPEEGYKGTDKFKYVIRDEYGNYSTPVTVSIKVSKRLCDTVYKDMEYREEYNAAVAMTATGIMTGKLVGDDLYFQPDETVTRAEFVAMAMKSLGIRADSTLTSTFFDDNDNIPQSLRGYIATAQRIGIINGDFKDGKLMFSPNEEITEYEAATILAKLIGVDSESEECVFSDDPNIPVWARTCVSAMYTMGVFDLRHAERLSDSVTRADAANYLYRIINNI